MIKLIEPNVKYLQSYKEAYQEHQENNVSSLIFNDATRIDIFEKCNNYKYEKIFHLTELEYTISVG